MKLCIVLILCFNVISSNPIPGTKHWGSKVKETVKECLISYNLNPAITELEKEENFDLYDKLTEEQQACVYSCVYRGFNWLRADGSLDFEILNDGDTPEEAAKFIKNAQECRAEFPKDDCKFFMCIDKKDV